MRQKRAKCAGTWGTSSTTCRSRTTRGWATPCRPRYGRLVPVGRHESQPGVAGIKLDRLDTLIHIVQTTNQRHGSTVCNRHLAPRQPGIRKGLIRRSQLDLTMSIRGLRLNFQSQKPLNMRDERSAVTTDRKQPGSTRPRVIFVLPQYESDKRSTGKRTPAQGIRKRHCRVCVTR